MKMIVEEVDSHVEGIKISCTPIEALVLNHAMQLFADTDEVCEIDRDIMKRMLKDFADGLDQSCEIIKRDTVDKLNKLS